MTPPLLLFSAGYERPVRTLPRSRAVSCSLRLRCIICPCTRKCLTCLETRCASYASSRHLLGLMVRMQRRPQSKSCRAQQRWQQRPPAQSRPARQRHEREHRQSTASGSARHGATGERRRTRRSEGKDANAGAMRESRAPGVTDNGAYKVRSIDDVQDLRACRFLGGLARLKPRARTWPGFRSRRF